MTREEDLRMRAIDVSHLPTTVYDTKAPIWWGNALLLAIETTVFACMLAVYFTTWTTLSPFPPPQVDHYPINLNPVPALTIPTINLIVLLVSLVPAILLDRAGRRRDEGAAKVLLVATLAFNVAAIVLRFYEFNSLLFRWDDNAYASIIWTILGMHLIHLFVMAFEDVYSLAWVLTHGLDEKHAVDVTVVAVYWYWIVAVWVLFYGVIYIAPRF